MDTDLRQRGQFRLEPDYLGQSGTRFVEIAPQAETAGEP
jgi:hypothetical protein